MLDAHTRVPSLHNNYPRPEDVPENLMGEAIAYCAIQDEERERLGIPDMPMRSA